MKNKRICLLLLCAGFTLTGCSSLSETPIAEVIESIRGQEEKVNEDTVTSDPDVEVVGEESEGEDSTSTREQEPAGFENEISGEFETLLPENSEGTANTDEVGISGADEDVNSITSDGESSDTSERETAYSDGVISGRSGATPSDSSSRNKNTSANSSDDLTTTLLSNSLMQEDNEPDLEGNTGIVDVWWNNDKDSYVPRAEDTEITIYLNDHTERQKGFTLNTGASSVVTGDTKIDIDNDGEDEYAVEAYFGNTAAEYNFVYIFKHVNNKIVSIYPNKEIEAQFDDCINTEFTTVEKDGQTLNALEVTTYDKEDGETFEDYHAILVFENGHWVEFN